jgi:hypothetical protein
MSHAQQAQESSYQALSNRFFDLVKQGKTADAVDYLFETNPDLAKMTDDRENLKTQFGSLKTLMGSYLSNTKLLETRVAGMYVYQRYFVAYQRQPISVRIKYYKPGATWLCFGLQFDTKLSDEIQAQSDARIPMDTN